MIQKGQILVATRTQYRKCGQTLIHMDQIVKAANYEDESTMTIIVFRSKNREKKNDWDRVDTDDNAFRVAKDYEIKMWEAGIRNCAGELV
jgi:hypothetical protein